MNNVYCLIASRLRYAKFFIVLTAIFVIGPISHSVYAQAERPKAYGLLIDNTRSLEKEFDQVKLFGEGVVERVHTQGPVQLFSFKCTRSISSVAESLNATSANAKGAPADKVMVLITDGEHRMEMIGTSQPTETEDERSRRDSKLRKYLKDSGIKVLAIGITGELDTGENRRLQAENYLTRLIKETGGRVVFCRSKRVDIEKLVNQLLGS